MHDIVTAFLSVCLQHALVLGQNGWTCHHTFLPSGKSGILVFLAEMALQ